VKVRAAAGHGDQPTVPKARKSSSRGRTTNWMNGFHLHSGPSLEEVVEHAYGETSDDVQEGSW